MKEENPYLRLAHYILPEAIESSFELVDVQEEGRKLHLYLGEKAEVSLCYQSAGLSPGGFYETGCIQDFPLQDKRVKLYVRRRRRVGKTAVKSVSGDWDLVAQGTRYPKEFAAFKRAARRNTRLRLALLNASFMFKAMNLSVNTRSI